MGMAWMYQENGIVASGLRGAGLDSIAGAVVSWQGNGPGDGGGGRRVSCHRHTEGGLFAHVEEEPWVWQ